MAAPVFRRINASGPTGSPIALEPECWLSPRLTQHKGRAKAQRVEAPHKFNEVDRVDNKKSWGWYVRTKNLETIPG